MLAQLGEALASSCRRSSSFVRWARGSGGGYRITKTEQIDFHIGFGLNHNAPPYFRVGYIVSGECLF
jgi:hypothetical protein